MDGSPGPRRSLTLSLLGLLIFSTFPLSTTAAECLEGQQPVVESVFPPSGTSQTVFTISGENLTQTLNITLQQGGEDVPILIGPNRSKESVQFMLAGGISSDSRATLLLIPVQMGCENISVDLFLLRRGVFFSLTMNDVQLGTVIVSMGCLPPECGDNSTNYDILVSEQQLQRIDGDNLFFVARFPATINVSTMVPVIIRSQYSDLFSTSQSTVNIFAPFPIDSVTPSTGQKGTIVEIRGSNLFGRGAGTIVLSRVVLGSSAAEIMDGASSTLIRVRVNSGDPGSTSLIINTTQTVTASGTSYRNDGPYTHNNSIWTQLEDGEVVEIVPLAAQPGVNISVIGERLLGGGTEIESISIAGQIVAYFSSVQSKSNDSMEYMVVTVPGISGDETRLEGRIVITADTGAIIESLPTINFTYAAVLNITPTEGQVGTQVTITGIELLSGYDVEPVVTLSGIRATVISYNESVVVVRAEDPTAQLMMSGSGSGVSEDINITNITGDVRLIVSRGDNESFTVSAEDVWTYREAGEITEVEPEFGQYGTEISLRGSNLFGYGESIMRAQINGTESMIVSQSNSIVVLMAPNLSIVGLVDVVLVSETGAEVRGDQVFEYRERGVIVSVNPPLGQNGTFVNITGTNLFGHGGNITTVTFGGVEADIDFTVTTTTLVRIRIRGNSVLTDTLVAIEITAATSALVTSNGNVWTYLVPGEIENVTPDSGQNGTMVEISGTNLLGGGSTVQFILLDAVPATVQRATDTSIMVTMGSLSNQSDFFRGEVYVMSNTGSVVSGGKYTHQVPGQITNFNPKEGREGTRITIEGINLLGYGNNISNVSIAGIAGRVVEIESDSLVIVEAGAGQGGMVGSISFTSDTGAIVSSAPGLIFTYQEQGSITDVTPAVGGEGSGVSISGSALSPPGTLITRVAIGGYPVSRIVTQSDTRVSVLVGPALEPNSTDIPVTITASDGSSITGGNFSYLSLTISLPLRNQGQWGTIVRILLPNDVNFRPSFPLIATIGGGRADIVESSIAGGYIEVAAPRATLLGTYTADVAVQGINGRVARLQNGFTYLPEGIIFSATPSSGQQGTWVTVVGENLLGGGSEISFVRVGRDGVEVMAEPSNATNTTVKFRISSNPPQETNFPFVGGITLVADTGATIFRNEGFTFLEPGEVFSLSPSQGQFGTTVTISGARLLQGGSFNDIQSVSLAGTEVLEIIRTSNLGDDELVVRANEAQQTSPSSVIITLTTGAQIVSPSGVTFQYIQPGVIETVTPNVGTAGTMVTITGSNLLGGGTQVKDVLLGGVVAMLVNANDTVIMVVAQVPMGGSGSGSGNDSNIVEIIITTEAVIAGGSWTYEELGVIQDISPTEGQRGVMVNVSGTSLLGSSASNFSRCSVGGIEGIVRFSSNTAATCEAGFNPFAGASSDTSQLSGPVQLIANSGPVINSTLMFTYYIAFITSLSPSNGTNGTYVTITGQNLVSFPGRQFEVESITLGGVLVLKVMEVSLGSIRVRAGYSTTSNGSSVEIRSTSGALLEMTSIWEYEEPGKVESISLGVAMPGENVTIKGTNLVPPCVPEVRVIVGQTESYTAIIIDTSTIEFRPGPYQADLSGQNNLDNPGTLLPIQIVASDGATVYSSDVLFEYAESPARVTSISPTVGVAGTVVTIEGQNLLNGSDEAARVTLAGVEATILNSSDLEVTVNATEGPEEGRIGRVIIESENSSFIAGIGSNVWRYLPLVTSAQVSPRSGQNGTQVEVDLLGILDTFNITSATLAGIPAEVVGTNGTTVTLRAGDSPQTTLGDIVFELTEGVMLKVADAWKYEEPISVSLLDPPQGYFNTQVRLQGVNFNAGGAAISSVFLAGLRTRILHQSDSEVAVRVIEFRNSSTSSIGGPVVIYSTSGAVYVSSTLFTYVQLRIDSVTPQTGQGGTVVTIAGVGLLAGSSDTSFLSFSLASVNIQSSVSASNTQIQVIAGASATSFNAGNLLYTLRLGEGMVLLNNTWQYLSPGVVNSISPAQGRQGDFVTIRGENMLQGGGGVATVLLDSIPALVVVVGFDDFIQFRAGRSSQGTTSTITIMSDSGATLKSSQIFQYLKPGTISEISPAEGQNGTRVTVRGTGFTTGGTVSRVSLDGVVATVNDPVEDTSFIVEAGRPGTFGSFSGPVVVEMTTGTVIYGSTNFTYLSEGVVFTAEPQQGQVGTMVTIRGERLFGGGSEVAAVYLAGVEAGVNVSETVDSSVNVTAMDGGSSRRTGDIVLVSNTGAYIRKINAWTYVEAGTITGIEPEEGQFGTQITIEGTGLLSGGTSISDVLIGNVSAYQVLAGSSTQVIARAGQPYQIDTFSDTITLVSNSGGELRSNVSWTYRNSSQVSMVLPSSGAGNTEVAVIGENLLGGGTNISSVTTIDVAALSIATNVTDTNVMFKTGINPSGRRVTGDIVIQSNTGALTIVEDGWTYIDACPSGQFGTHGSCSPCDSECVECTGPTDEDCLACANFTIPLEGSSMRCVSRCPNVSTLANVCVDTCNTNQFVRVNSSLDAEFCYDCHDLCDDNFGCTGPERTQCDQCEFFFDTVPRICVRSCRVQTWQNEKNECIPCDTQCKVDAGCTGDTNADCNMCRNVSLAASLVTNSDSGSTAATNVGDICLTVCPTGFYSDGGICRRCSTHCAGGCTGPTAFYCNSCAMFSVELEAGLRCVSTCNPDASAKTMYDDRNGFCQLCSSLCSLEGGCNGPTASDCAGCRNDSVTGISLPRFNATCVLACPNTTASSSSPPPSLFYYSDRASGNCEVCDVTCSNGCTGSGAENCIQEVTDETVGLFDAGGGAIGIFVAIIVLLIVVVLLTLLFLWFGFKRSRNKYGVAMDERRFGTEMSGRTQQNIYRHQTEETSFAPEGQKEPAESKGAINSSFEANTEGEFYYTQMSPTKSVAGDVKANFKPTSPTLVIVEEKNYQQVNRENEATLIHNEGAELYVDPSEELEAPARPPKPEDAKGESRPPLKLEPKSGKERRPAMLPPPGPEDKPVKPGKQKPPPPPPSSFEPELYTDMDGSSRPPPALPSDSTEPDLYTDMEASVKEIHLKHDPDEDYSEMTQIPPGAAMEDELYDEASTVPQTTVPVKDQDKAPLIEDDMYEDTETTLAAYQKIKQQMAAKSPALPPSIPSQPIPKKRASVPLPVTPLEISLQGTEPTNLYEVTDGKPEEEMLYEAIPAGIIQGSRVGEAPPSPEQQSRWGQSSSQKPKLPPKGKR